MKKYYTFLLVLMCSCNIPEHFFTNPPACANEPYSLESIRPLIKGNQAEVKDKIRAMDAKAYRYFFKSFYESEGNTYMITSFAKNEQCFLVKMLVNKWDKLSGMRKTNGAYYPKELFDLQWSFSIIDGKEEVVYVDMHPIID